MTRPYLLTRGAATDLRHIVRYTVQTWGVRLPQQFSMAALS